jgi:DNA helicase-2/ATP-dependent DNA helicase PcrA
MDLGHICTFHSFCVKFLRDEINVLNFPKNFVILDPEDQKLMLGRIFSDMNLTLRDMTVRKALDNVLETRKLSALSYIDYIYLMDNERLKEAYLNSKDMEEAIFLRYLYEQKKIFGCDFNDLIALTIYILENFPDICQKWQEKMQYVMVDEFQDVSARQYRLARILAGHHGNNIIVGDPDQTIYSWRGAHVKLFLDFDKVYPGAKTIDLGLNYRSTPQIAAAASSLIARNSFRLKREFSTSRPDGSRPSYYHAKTDDEETKWVCRLIDRIHKEGLSLNDMAILYRTHRYVTRELEENLTFLKIPYRIYSGTEFYGRREIKDIICYLRMIAYGDDAAFLRTYNTPKRRIGRKKLDYLRQYAEENRLSLFNALRLHLDSPAFQETKARTYVRAIELTRQKRSRLALDNLLQTILDLSGYEEYLRLQGEQERLDNAAELKRSMAVFAEDEEATLEDFLDRAALFSNYDRDPPAEAVKLMTIHAAKGLEFNHVFLLGFSEGILPSSRSTQEEELEEERRLAYVAMTRAIDGLYISDAEGRAPDGQYKIPSRFVWDIGEHLLEVVNPVTHFRNMRRPNPPRKPLLGNLFQPGDLVVHAALGRGRIQRVDTEQKIYSIRFDFLPTDRSLRLDTELTRWTPEPGTESAPAALPDKPRPSRPDSIPAGLPADSRPGSAAGPAADFPADPAGNLPASFPDLTPAGPQSSRPESRPENRTDDRPESFPDEDRL